MSIRIIISIIISTRMLVYLSSGMERVSGV